MSTEAHDREFAYQDSDFESIRHRIHQVAGIWLSDSKRQMVYSRIVRRLRALTLKRFQDYLAFMDAHPDELELFINALTTNLTSFFREGHHFEALRDILLERRQPGQTMRIWCAAASTGEEPYSIAMTAVQAFESLSPPVSILATDIDSQVLDVARNGVYAESRIKDVPLPLKQRFFLRGRGAKAGLVQVRSELRPLIRFERLNLLDTRWNIQPGLDVIFCRNVMIYFDKPTQLSLLQRMIPLLKPDGYYVAGHSESISRDLKGLRLVGKTLYRKLTQVTE